MPRLGYGLVCLLLAGAVGVVSQPQAQTTTTLRGPKGVDYGAEGRTIGPLTSSDTLWRTAVKVRPNSSVTVYQVMVALYHKNPESFLDNNINHLVPNAVLKIPSLAEIKAEDPALAMQKTEQDDKLWQKRQRGELAKGEVEQAEKKVTTARQEDVEQAKNELKEEINQLKTDQVVQLTDLKDKFSQSAENVGSLLDENNQLKERLERISKEIKALQAQREEEQALRQKLEDYIDKQNAELARRQQELELQKKQAAEHFSFGKLMSEILSNPLYLSLALLVPVLGIILVVWLIVRRRKTAQQRVEPAFDSPVAAPAAAVAGGAAAAVMAEPQSFEQMMGINLDEPLSDDTPFADDTLLSDDVLSDDLLADDLLYTEDQPALESDYGNGLLESDELDQLLAEDDALSAMDDDLMADSLGDEPLPDAPGMGDDALDDDLLTPSAGSDDDELDIDSLLDEQQTGSVDLASDTLDDELDIDALIENNSNDAEDDLLDIDALMAEHSGDAADDSLITEAADDAVVDDELDLSDTELLTADMADEPALDNADEAEELDIDAMLAEQANSNTQPEITEQYQSADDARDELDALLGMDDLDEPIAIESADDFAVETDSEQNDGDELDALLGMDEPDLPLEIERSPEVVSDEQATADELDALLGMDEPDQPLEIEHAADETDDAQALGDELDALLGMDEPDQPLEIEHAADETDEAQALGDELDALLGMDEPDQPLEIEHAADETDEAQALGDELDALLGMDEPDQPLEIEHAADETDDAQALGDELDALLGMDEPDQPLEIEHAADDTPSAALNAEQLAERDLADFEALLAATEQGLDQDPDSALGQAEPESEDELNLGPESELRDTEFSAPVTDELVDDEAFEALTHLEQDAQLSANDQAADEVASEVAEAWSELDELLGVNDELSVAELETTNEASSDAADIVARDTELGVDEATPNDGTDDSSVDWDDLIAASAGSDMPLTAPDWQLDPAPAQLQGVDNASRDAFEQARELLAQDDAIDAIDVSDETGASDEIDASDDETDNKVDDTLAAAISEDEITDNDDEATSAEDSAAVSPLEPDWDRLDNMFSALAQEPALSGETACDVPLISQEELGDDPLADSAEFTIEPTSDDEPTSDEAQVELPSLADANENLETLSDDELAVESPSAELASYPELDFSDDDLSELSLSADENVEAIADSEDELADEPELEIVGLDDLDDSADDVDVAEPQSAATDELTDIIAADLDSASSELGQDLSTISETGVAEDGVDEPLMIGDELVSEVELDSDADDVSLEALERQLAKQDLAASHGLDMDALLDDSDSYELDADLDALENTDFDALLSDFALDESADDELSLESDLDLAIADDDLRQVSAAASDLDDDALDDLLTDELGDEPFVAIDDLLAQADDASPLDEPFDKVNIDVGLSEFDNLLDDGELIDVDLEGAGYAAKLDLARAYLEIEDFENAQKVLQEVIDNGPDDLRDEALSLQNR